MFDSVEVINLGKNSEYIYKWKEKVQRILSCLFGGRRKVEITKFAFEDFIFVVSSAANLVGTTLEFAAFRSRLDAKDSRASAFWFFLSTTMAFAAVRTHFLRKDTSIFMSIGILSRFYLGE